MRLSVVSLLSIATIWHVGLLVAALPDLERQARELEERHRRWAATPPEDRPKMPDPPEFVAPHRNFFGRVQRGAHAHQEEDVQQEAQARNETGEYSDSSKSQEAAEITIDWSYTVRVSDCKPSTSIVPTPLFNSSVSNVSQQIWNSYGNLSIPGLARILMWVEWPQNSVPQLSPPDLNSRTTSWDFTNFMSQFGQFMDQTSSSAPPLIAATTWPDWFIDGLNWNLTTLGPNTLTGVYTAQGVIPMNFTQNIADYYGSMAEYLINGNFLDIFGNNVTGGPSYGLDRIQNWEVLEEPDCPAPIARAGTREYIAIYDAIVSKIRTRVDPHHKIKFTGLVLCGHGNSDEWWRPWFTAGNHIASVQDALDGASIHYYPVVFERDSNRTWSAAMFTGLDQFVDEMRIVMALRDELSPKTQIYVDELGAFLPPQDAPVPDFWFIASHAHDMVAFARLSELGISMTGFSQFVGNPRLMNKNQQVPSRQNPALSLINWTTGLGNARYWGLKLMVEEFGEGDTIVETVRPGQVKMCSSKWNYDSIAGQRFPTPPQATITLSCPEDGSYISGFGHVSVRTQHGNCDDGFVVSHPNCTDNGTMLEAAKKQCLGQKSCMLNQLQAKMYMNGVGSPAGAPNCAPYWTNMVVEAYCANGKRGYASSSAYKEDRIYLQSRVHGRSGKKKVLFANENNEYATLRLPGMTGGKARIVDDNAPAREIDLTHDDLLLKPFATGVILLPDHH